MTADPAHAHLRARLRNDLGQAMKARDTTAVTALRSALGTIDNAEAVDPSRTALPPAGTSPIAGALPGLGAGEVARRTLTEADIVDLVRAEISQRRAAADEYERSGMPDRAIRLASEADVLARYLDESEGG